MFLFSLFHRALKSAQNSNQSVKNWPLDTSFSPAVGFTPKYRTRSWKLYKHKRAEPQSSQRMQNCSKALTVPTCQHLEHQDKPGQTRSNGKSNFHQSVNNPVNKRVGEKTSPGWEELIETPGQVLFRLHGVSCCSVCTFYLLTSSDTNK